MKTVHLVKPFVIAPGFSSKAFVERIEAIRSPDDGLTFELLYGGTWHPESKEANVYCEDSEGNTLFELWNV